MVDAVDFGFSGAEGVIEVSDARVHASLKVKGFGATVEVRKHGPHEFCHTIAKGVGMESRQQ